MIVLAAAFVSLNPMPFRLGNIEYAAALIPEAAEPLAVYRGSRVVASAGLRAWKPWRLEVADVDGDGRSDLALGVHKPTRQLPEPHHTLFIYSFNGTQITKKWLGSSMGRPLIDFCFGRDRSRTKAPLYTLEKSWDGQVALSRYRWSGFGFRKEEKEQFFAQASRLRRAGANIEVEDGGQTIASVAGS